MTSFDPRQGRDDSAVDGDATSTDATATRLAAELRDAGAALAVTGDPRRAIDRADQRRRRRQAVTGLAAVTLIAGLALGFSAAQPANEQSVIAAADGPADDNAPAPATSAAPDFAWTVAPADVSFPAASFVGTDGYRYALSTAPGVRYEDSRPDGTYQQAIYRTLDGTSWEVVSTPDRNITSLAGYGGLLYSVSTSAEPDDTIVSHVETSGDGGTSWNQKTLSFDLPRPSDTNTLLRGGAGPSLSLTAGDSSLLVTARQNYWLDEAATLEHLGIDVPGATVYVYNDGEIVQVLDGTACAATWTTVEWDESDSTPAECQNQPVLAATTLTDLGIEGALEVSRAAVSTDGENWTIGAAAPGYQTWFAGSTFVSTGWDESGNTTLWRSADGLNWDAPTWVDASYQIVGAFDDTLVAHFEGDNGTGIATSTDGARSWSQISAADIGGDYVASAAAGDLGIVVVTGRFTGEDVSDFQLSVSSDGINWQTTPVADIASISAGYPSFAFVDDDHVGVVLDGVTRNADGTVSGLTLLGTPSR